MMKRTPARLIALSMHSWLHLATAGP